ncbi:bacteriocin-like protein [Chryseobacterium gotjawalense]
MKNLKKLSRGELKSISGGKLAPESGGCESGHGCACGAIYNNFTPGTPHWDCCSCPRQGF